MVSSFQRGFILQAAEHDLHGAYGSMHHLARRYCKITLPPPSSGSVIQVQCFKIVLYPVCSIRQQVFGIIFGQHCYANIMEHLSITSITIASLRCLGKEE